MAAKADEIEPTETTMTDMALNTAPHSGTTLTETLLEVATAAELLPVLASALAMVAVLAEMF